MRSLFVASLLLCLATPAAAQVTQSREQILFYTRQWTGPRFPDGRPKLPDDLLKRALDCTIEDLWDFLGGHGYRNQFEAGWQGLHLEKPFAGRAITTQYMPARPDMAEAMAAEGRSEGRDNLSSNGWPIAMLQAGDMWVVDGYGKIVEGTIVGSNLGNAVAAKGANFVFNAGIRDEEELKEIPNFNGFYRGQDPSAWAQMQLVSVNGPIHVGRATVLPGDLVLAKPQGVIVIPAFLAEDAISSAEFTGLMDAYNFELNRSGANGTTFEGGWNAAKYAALGQWVAAHPERLKMSRAEFDKLLARHTRPRP